MTSTPAPPTAQDSQAEQRLLAACRQGDAAAWEELVRRYERLVFSIPLRLGLSRSEADDIYQLTFTYLLQNLNAIQDSSRLVGWLATVARRQTWLFIHRARRETPTLDEMEALTRKMETELKFTPQQAETAAWEMIREKYILLPAEESLSD